MKRNNKEKKDNKLILVSVIVIYMILMSSSVLYLSSQIKDEDVECEEVYSRNEIHLDKKERKMVCSKGINSTDNYDVYIEQVITYDLDLAIQTIDSKTVYEFDNEDGYNELKDKLNHCKDTYNENGKIKCDIDEDYSDFIHKWAHSYINAMANQGFVCY